MTILAVHRQKPNWPDDPKRPRFEIKYDDMVCWAETDGTAPSDVEMDAFLDPPIPPRDPAVLLQALLSSVGLTVDELKALLKQ